MDPPGFMIGVQAQINLVLFKSRFTGTEPYKLPEGVVSWKFVMDNDWDRQTPPKIRGDDENITVTETDTQTMISIPISQMSSPDLDEILGENRYESGFTGEIAGYNENGVAIFGLQIEGFRFYRRLFEDD